MKRILILALLFASAASMSNAAVATPYRYVISETGKFSSLDPLDADTTSNLPVARMIYATPLESSTSNQLTSRVLESFRYDTKTKSLEWIVKKDLQYSDGTALTAEDVGFAVARMAHARPKFPVLSAIAGLSGWIHAKHALKSFPAGIRIDGQKITIQFTDDVDHPLFRFCLELFSIIPRRCVSSETGKISCERIPESGPYKIVSQDAKSVTFERRSLTDATLPTPIRFDYVPPKDLAELAGTIDAKTVVAGSEADYSPNQIHELSNRLNIKYLPASRFEAVLINKEVGPFADRNCRQTFARQFRIAFHSLAPERNIEGSLFTKLLPGYETLAELDSTKASNSECKKQFTSSEIPWGFEESDRDSLFVRAVSQAFAVLGAKSSKPKVFSSRKDFAEAFSSGTIAFFNAGSGFWALDPAGDARMLFTPNLHRPLKQLTSDDRLQSLLEKLGDRADAYQAVSRSLFDDALLNIYSHQRRFFATSKATSVEALNFAITSPAPWQVFRAQ